MLSAKHLALAAAIVLPLPAMAQPAPPPAPEALQAQIRDWIADRLGPHAAADLPIHVVPEADHLRIAVADPALAGAAEATAVLHPTPDGRWALDDIHIPPAAFALATPRGPADVSFSAGAQNSHAVVDPTLSAASTIDFELKDASLSSSGPGVHFGQHAAQLDAHARLMPHGGEADFDHQTTIIGWRGTSRMPGKSVAVAADKVQASGHIAGLDRDRAQDLLASLAGVLSTLPADLAALQRGAPLPPPARAAMLAWIGALDGPVTDAHGTETVSGLTVAVAGQGEAHVRQLRLAADLSAPHGLVHGWFDVAIDGLRADGLPNNESALVPTRVALHPTVAGVRLADLTTFMQEATDRVTPPARLRDDAQTLLLHRGVTLGLESMTVSLGPATFFGHGHVSLTRHGEYRVDAHFVASGFDTLMSQAASDPALRRSLPVLAVMRGFARQEGNRLMWDVLEENGRLTVNGIPLSASDQGDSR